MNDLTGEVTQSVSTFKPRDHLAGRLLAIDGLRGVAAMAVVFYHLSGNLKLELLQILPTWLMTIFEHGYLGVPIFFVLSGFVIAASIKSSTITPGYVARFALRRSIRLDLVYWAAIVLALILMAVKQTVLGSEVDYPSLAEIALHTIYLQDIAQVKNQISPVFWTLCLEIQFYIFFVISVYFCGLSQSSKSLLLNSFLVASVSLISSMIYSGIMKLSVSGLFLPYWTFFALGCLCYRALKHGGLHSLLFFMILDTSLTTTLWSKNISYIIGASAAVMFIYVLANFGWLKFGLSNKYIQFLGMISYSLYLTHPDIGWKFISILKIAAPSSQKPAVALGIFVLGILVSIGFAYIFFKLIEKPSHALSKNIEMRE